MAANPPSSSSAVVVLFHGFHLSCDLLGFADNDCRAQVDAFCGYSKRLYTPTAYILPLLTRARPGLVLGGT